MINNNVSNDNGSEVELFDTLVVVMNTMMSWCFTPYVVNLSSFLLCLPEKG